MLKLLESELFILNLLFQSLIWELLDNKGQSLSLENVLKCLDNLYESLTERADLLPGPEKVIGTLSVDFALFLGKIILE